MTELGRDWTADLWFSAERDFWMRRNRAARVQKARQDALGLGILRSGRRQFLTQFEALLIRCQRLARLTRLNLHVTEFLVREG